MLYYRDLLKEIKGIKLNELNNNISYNYSYFPIVLMDEYGFSRDELVDELNKEGIFPRKYFYPIITDLSCYSSFKNSDVPVARDVASRVLTLPLYPDLEKEKIKNICNLIKKYERKC